MPTVRLFSEAARLLQLADPAAKCAGVAALAVPVAAGDFTLDSEVPVPDVTRPGRPALPLLVEPSRVPRRRLAAIEGRRALAHAIAHIEFNAINLALDAACRFRDQPREYYRDWISVAADEARHFGMVARRLAELGAAYGDYPAHDGLWEIAVDTAESCLLRMALVPRVLEARGLDVTPDMIARLRQAGDETTAALLEIILGEEVGHVAIGSRWFRHACRQAGLDQETAFTELLATHYRGTVRGPFNVEARLSAGFTPAEIARLELGRSPSAE